MNSNTGHGHVFKRPDGVRARCGGPLMCSQCVKDQASMTTPATRAHAHLPADLESRAIAMLDDDQAFASFGRWMEVVNAAKRARSLREKLGVEEYVAAIYREIPA